MTSPTTGTRADGSPATVVPPSGGPADTVGAAGPSGGTAGSSGATAAATPRRRLPAPGMLLERYGLVLLLVAMAVFFAVAPASTIAFRSSANWLSLTSNQAVTLVVALALLFPMAAGYFDFSVGAVAAISSVIAATAMSRFGLPVWVAVLLAMAGGLVVGALQGALVAYLQMNAFIATLGTATLLGGAIFAYTEGLQITQGLSPSLIGIGSDRWLGVPSVVVLAAVVAAVCWFVLGQTTTGRQLFSVGANPAASRLIGVDVPRIQFTAFVLSGLVASLAGVLLLARQGAATSDSGMSMLFPALTAVLLSTIVIDVGRPSVLGTVVGVLFLAISISGLTLLGTPAWVSSVFTGAALLIAVAVASLGRLRHRT